MEDYEQQTIDLIKSKNKEFETIPDEKIQILYWQWSVEKFSANWMEPTENYINDFIRWAIMRPLDYDFEEFE